MKHREFSMEKLSEMAMTAMRQAVARVMEDHRRRGKPVAIWKDGRVVLKIPDVCGEVREPAGRYETGYPGQIPNQNRTDKGV